MYQVRDINSNEIFTTGNSPIMAILAFYQSKGLSYSELLNSDTVVVRVDRVIDELYGEIVNTTDIVKYATKITDYIEIFEAIRYIGE